MFTNLSTCQASNRMRNDAHLTPALTTTTTALSDINTKRSNTKISEEKEKEKESNPGNTGQLNDGGIYSTGVTNTGVTVTCTPSHGSFRCRVGAGVAASALRFPLLGLPAAMESVVALIC